MQHPRLGALWLNRKRRFVMKHVPYSIIYTLDADEMKILAVAHHSRRPGYWRKRK